MEQLQKAQANLESYLIPQLNFLEDKMANGHLIQMKKPEAGQSYNEHDTLS